MTTYSQQSNGLTPAQSERLFCLLEEMGEAQQAIGKILRHGYESRDPSATNRETLARELGDVQRAINMLLEAHDLSSAEMKAVLARWAPLRRMHQQAT